MDTLPDDVLRETFAWLKPQLKDTFTAENDLFGLLQVCRRWRDLLLLSWPTLWSQFSVDLDGHRPTPRSINRLTDKISVYLRASQHMPLTILLHVPWGHPVSAHIVDLLLTESRRWQDISLNIDPLLYARLGSATHIFPSLTRLSIQLPELGLQAQAQTFFTRLPALIHLRLRLSARAISWNAFGPDIWPRLQSCYLAQLTLGDALSLLPRFSKHASVTIANCNSEAIPLRSLTSTAVSEFTLKECSARFTTNLLNTLAAPHLEKLSVLVSDYCSDDGRYVLPSISTFLQRAATPTLTHLRLTNPHLSMADFTNALMDLLRSPKLRRLLDLDLDLCHGRKSPGEILSLLAAPSPLVPELRWLSIRGCNYIRGTDILALRRSQQRRNNLAEVWLHRGMTVLASGSESAEEIMSGDKPQIRMFGTLF